MLGSKVYTEILLEGVLKERGYIAQNTKLGWIISGKSDNYQQKSRGSLCVFTKVNKNQSNRMETPGDTTHHEET